MVFHIYIGGLAATFQAMSLQGLPKYCLAGQDKVSPLICFHMVELHQPDLVLCQFSLQ